MVAPRVSPWAIALCAPLLLSEARGRHAHRAVRLHDGVRGVFEQVFLGAILRMLGRMAYALSTLRVLDLLSYTALLFAGIVAIAIGATLLGIEGIPRGGHFAHCVRMRPYHPLLLWLASERCRLV